MYSTSDVENFYNHVAERSSLVIIKHDLIAPVQKQASFPEAQIAAPLDNARFVAHALYVLATTLYSR